MKASNMDLSSVLKLENYVLVKQQNNKLLLIETDQTSNNLITYIQIIKRHGKNESFPYHKFKVLRIIHYQRTRRITSLNEANEEARVNLV